MDSRDVIVRYEAGVPDIIRLPGKHFLQEDQAPAIAERIEQFVGPGPSHVRDWAP